ncbi:MAG: hypothetical protein FWH27_10410 [Planctomycetaceae bacterium]|nr:hypothetical protein [Planctomycetaceae bacterium]
MNFELCPLHSALCTLHSALCTLHSALCALHSALCILHSALCTETIASNLPEWYDGSVRSVLNHRHYVLA